MTAGIERLNLSIWDARIHTTRYGYALDTFVVLDHANQPITDAAELRRIQQVMQEQMQNPRPGRDMHHAHVSRTLKHFPIETSVSFSVSPNGQTTVMEVVAQDRPGLLYQVALSLAACNLKLVTAKVATFGERVEDIFFIATPDGKLVTETATQEALKREIVERLDPKVEQPEVRAIEI
jgi:[protein-PII] uridylyltransferase